MFAGAAISWQAKKQTTVAQSTVESEYAAMALALKEMIWLQYLLRDLLLAALQHDQAERPVLGDPIIELLFEPHAIRQPRDRVDSHKITNLL